MLGFTIRVPRGVFNPRFSLSTRFFGKQLRKLDLRGLRVLDMGCGTGILALVAAGKGSQVTAVDINPLAVQASRDNVDLNHMTGRVVSLESDLFSALPADAVFDLMIWNPPFFPVDPPDMASRAWFAGSDFDVLRAFARSARSHLAPGGKVMLVLSTDTDPAAFLSAVHDTWYRVTTVRSRRKLFETLQMIELSPPSPSTPIAGPPPPSQ